MARLESNKGYGETLKDCSPMQIEVGCKIVNQTFNEVLDPTTLLEKPFDASKLGPNEQERNGRSN